MKHLKIPLSIFDRLTIPELLPREAKYETGVAARDIRQKIEVGQEEAKKINLRTLFPDHEKFRRLVNAMLRANVPLRATELGAEVTKIADECFPKSGPSNLVWDKAKVQPKDIEFTSVEYELIQGNLRKKNEEEELPTDPDTLALYEKFVFPKPAKSSKEGH